MSVGISLTIFFVRVGGTYAAPCFFPILAKTNTPGKLIIVNNENKSKRDFRGIAEVEPWATATELHNENTIVNGTGITEHVSTTSFMKPFV